MSIHGIVVAGGTSSRFGRNKLVEVVDGRPLREHSIQAAANACDQVVVVGFETADAPANVHVIREEPAGSGPFSAVAAGVSELDPDQDDLIIVLAGDLRNPAGAIPHLIAALEASSADVAVIVDSHHHRQPLCACYRAQALVTLVAATDPVGRPAMQLLDGLHIVEVPDDGGWSRDVDTPEDLDR